MALNGLTATRLLGGLSKSLDTGRQALSAIVAIGRLFGVVIDEGLNPVLTGPGAILDVFNKLDQPLDHSAVHGMLHSTGIFLRLFVVD